MARLMRLAAGVLFVTLILNAFVGVQVATAAGRVHRCVHDAVQQEALEDATDAVEVSPVGLPYVAEKVGATAVETLAGSSAPSVTRTVAWGDFRITTSTLDLTTAGSYCATVGQTVNNHRGVTVTCTEADILTSAKRDTLINYLLPEAIQMHTDRLQVKRVKSTWAVTGMSRAVCSNFIVPTQHSTYGVSRTDFMLYVSSVPSDDDVLAWSITCQVFSNDQPAVGVLNVPAAYISGEYDAQMVHAITHELAHALGFSNTFFNSLGMLANVTGIRGKTTAAAVLTSPNVVSAVQNHYNCSTATNMELEDFDPTGLANSHWKQRNAADELMAPVMSVGYYTNLTMAAFADTGFYNPVYSKAESMTWGRNASCTLLDGACVVDGVSQFPSMFCDTNAPTFRCSAGRLGMGTCEMTNYTTALPSYFQYFATATEGGMYDYYDYCPNVVEWDNGSCTQNASAAADNVTVFNVFSLSSRCIDGVFTPKEMAGATVAGYYGMCVSVRCDTQLSTYSIKVHGDSKFRACTAGQNVTLSRVSGNFEEGGYIICPAYAEVCQSNLQAAADFKAAVDATVTPRTAAMALLVLALTLICA